MWAMNATETYHVTGMSCQNCANTIERMMKTLPGVSEATVSFATETMKVARDERTSEQELLALLKTLGYDAEPVDDSKKKA